MSDRKDCSVSLIQADVAVGLELVKDNSIQLVITSPPYNLGKAYERDTSMSLTEYLEWLTPIIETLCRKVRDRGSICWQVGSFVHNGEVFPLDFFFYDAFVKQGFKLRNRVIWQFDFGLHAARRFSGRYETLLWFTKSDDYIFNLDAVRVPQKYPGKRHSALRSDGKAGLPSGNPLGKNPADFWTFSAEDCFKTNPVWAIPNVKANHPEHTFHPCQFPHELAERCVLAFTRPEDVVLDPFVGSGTSVIAAVKAGRRGQGIDRNPEYIQLTRKRIEALESGVLGLRPSGISVRVPKPGERVSSIPFEWLSAAE